MATRLVYFFTHLVHLSCKRMHEQAEEKRQQEVEENGEEEEEDDEEGSRIKGVKGVQGSKLTGERDREDDGVLEEHRATEVGKGMREKDFGKRRR